MSQNKVQVVFTKTNAIILVNNFKGIKTGYPVLVNPKINADHDFTRYWKIGRNNSVIEMTEEEKKQRDLDIDSFGLNNDMDIFLPELEKGSPTSKPIVIQEIKNTPILHIETKEIRHLDIKPIANFVLDPVSVNKLNVETINVAPILIEPIQIKPIEIIFPRKLEILEVLNTLIMFLILIYLIVKK